MPAAATTPPVPSDLPADTPAPAATSPAPVLGVPEPELAVVEQANYTRAFDGYRPPVFVTVGG